MVTPAVAAVVDDVIARAYLAVEIGLNVDGLARPVETLARLYEASGIGSEIQVFQTDIICRDCGATEHYVCETNSKRHGAAPARCREHRISRPCQVWRAA